MTATAKANSNFHALSPTSVFDTRLSEERFAQYRRKWLENPRDAIVEDFPLNLDVESTCACNLRCPFCATTSDNWGPGAKGYMDFDLYRRVIDEGAGHGLYALKLSFRGEPLLHRRLADMVAYAKGRGVLDVYFNTNGTLLDEDRFLRLMDAGLDRISVSIEGTGPESYESLRPGARFETVARNVRRLKDLRERRHSRHPRIRIQTVLLPQLAGGFRQYADFWAPYADEVACLDYRRESPADDHRGRRGDWACPFLYQRMTVLWDGTLLPCLMHGVRDFSLLALGNARDTGIAQAWKSARLESWRGLHQNGLAHELAACDQCSYRAMELDKLERT